jgi:hypothetical protein
LRGYSNLDKRGDEANPTKLIKQSLMRWGKDRKETETPILNFLGAQLPRIAATGMLRWYHRQYV